MILHHCMKQSFQLKIVLCLCSCLWLPNLDSAAGAESPPPMVKSNCPERCGNVTIAYPFGIGSGCFLNKWYEITCDHTTSKAFLPSIHLELLHISLVQSTVRVNSPVSLDCNNSMRSEAVNLVGTPFFYSSTYNRLSATGCNNIAYLNAQDSVGAACVSICNSTQRSAGRTGCQAIIPQDLQYFNTTLQPIDNTNQKCSRAYLVDTQWALESTTQTFVHLFQYVPVVLQWRTYNSCTNGSSTPCHTTNFCSGYAGACSCDDRRCSCRRGYQGNPYLSNGCEDIDECAQTQSNICDECHNSIGNYYCVCYTPGGGLPDNYADTFCNAWSSPPMSKTVRRLAIGFGTTGGSLALLIALWRFTKVVRKRREMKRKERFFKRNGGLLLQQQLGSSGESNVEKSKLFTSKELEKATDKFNETRILGQGGQGTVYKGMLSDGRIVAIKKSTLVDESQVEDFINEVFILSQINHRNVVKLLGCCLETEVPLLVYEFIPNGTLFQLLQESMEEFTCSWEMRLRIAKEVAAALSYLHNAASIPIYHRDVKSTNILLDDKYKSKVSDFGASRSITLDQTHLTTQVIGTHGYLDPEYFQSNQFTEKSDVYSFGVVLAELLTGQKSISFIRSPEERSLTIYFITAMKDKRLFDIIDAQVLKEAKKEEIFAVASLTKSCLKFKGKKRPSMKDVSLHLEGIRNTGGHLLLHPIVEDDADVPTDLIMSLPDNALASTMPCFDYSVASSSDVDPLYFE